MKVGEVVRYKIRHDVLEGKVKRISENYTYVVEEGGKVRALKPHDFTTLPKSVVIPPKDPNQFPMFEKIKPPQTPDKTTTKKTWDRVNQIPTGDR